MRSNAEVRAQLRIRLARISLSELVAMLNITGMPSHQRRCMVHSKLLLDQITEHIQKLENIYGVEIFRRSGALQPGAARAEYLRWYMELRKKDVAAFPDRDHVRIALILARKMRKEMTCD